MTPIGLQRMQERQANVCGTQAKGHEMLAKGHEMLAKVHEMLAKVHEMQANVSGTLAFQCQRTKRACNRKQTSPGR